MQSRMTSGMRLQELMSDACGNRRPARQQFLCETTGHLLERFSGYLHGLSPGRGSGQHVPARLPIEKPDRSIEPIAQPIAKGLVELRLESRSRRRPITVLDVRKKICPKVGEDRVETTKVARRALAVAEPVLRHICDCCSGRFGRQ